MRYLLFLILLFAVSFPALATDITIGAIAQEGFNRTDIGSDISIASVSVTNGSANITCSSCLPSSVVGLAGWRITLGAVDYTIASCASRSAATLTANYAAGTGTVSAILRKFVILRVYLTGQAFTPAGESSPIQQGAVGSNNWYLRVAASVQNNGSTNVLYLPQFILPATTNGTPATSRWSAWLYTQSGSAIQSYPGCIADWKLSHLTTPTSWTQICNFNVPPAPAPPDPLQYVTTRDLDARFPSCLANNLDYFLSTGNVKRCLTLGTNLSISDNTLNATAGSVGSAIVSVQEYGAVCDGSTDDSTAIQNALNGAYGVYLPQNKTCAFGTTLTVRKHQAIFGSGNKSILKYTGAGVAISSPDNPYTGDFEYNHIYFNNFQLLASAASTAGFQLTNNYETYFYGVYINGNDIGFTTAGVSIVTASLGRNSAGIVFRDGSIKNCIGDGIRAFGLETVGGLFVHGSHIQGNNGWGLYFSPNGNFTAAEFSAAYNLIEGNDLGQVFANVSVASSLTSNHLENAPFPNPSYNKPLVVLGNAGQGFSQTFTLQGNTMGGIDAPYLFKANPDGNFSGTIINNQFLCTGTPTTTAILSLPAATGVTVGPNSTTGCNAPLVSGALPRGILRLDPLRMSYGTGQTPDDSAAVDLNWSFPIGGVLFPRGVTSERDSITSPADTLTFANRTTHTLDFYNSNTGQWEQLGKVRNATNVKNFGAKGDGATNDTTAINAASAVAINAGNILYFPAGVYVFDGLVVASEGLNIEGDGPKSSILQSRTNANPVIKLDNAGVNVNTIVIRDLTLKGFGSGAGNHGLHISGATVRNSVTVENVKIHNCGGSAILSNGAVLFNSRFIDLDIDQPAGAGGHTVDMLGTSTNQIVRTYVHNVSDNNVAFRLRGGNWLLDNVFAQDSGTNTGIALVGEDVANDGQSTLAFLECRGCTFQLWGGTNGVEFRSGSYGSFYSTGLISATSGLNKRALYFRGMTNGQNGIFDANSRIVLQGTATWMNSQPVHSLEPPFTEVGAEDISNYYDTGLASAIQLSSVRQMRIDTIRSAFKIKNLALGTGSSEGVQSNVLFGPDNTYTIGQSGGRRPSEIYVAQTFFGPTIQLGVGGATAGLIRLQNIGNSNATRIQSASGSSDYTITTPSAPPTAGNEFVQMSNTGALSTNLAPWQNTGTDYTPDTTVANTTTETDLLGTMDTGTKTISANTARVGQMYKVHATGTLGGLSSGALTGNLTFNLKFGSTSIGSTGAIALNHDGTGTTWTYDALCNFTALGASGSITCHEGTFAYNTSNGSNRVSFGTLKTTTVVDTTGALTFALTSTFSVADAKNTITCTLRSIDQSR